MMIGTPLEDEEAETGSANCWQLHPGLCKSQPDFEMVSLAVKNLSAHLSNQKKKAPLIIDGQIRMHCLTCIVNGVAAATSYGILSLAPFANLEAQVLATCSVDPRCCTITSLFSYNYCRLWWSMFLQLYLLLLPS